MNMILCGEAVHVFMLNQYRRINPPTSARHILNYTRSDPGTCERTRHTAGGANAFNSVTVYCMREYVRQIKYRQHARARVRCELQSAFKISLGRNNFCKRLMIIVFRLNGKGIAPTIDLELTCVFPAGMANV